MNIPVDVIAVFNTLGNIKPAYIRLEKEDHSLITYQITTIHFSQEEKHAGISNIVYVCDILAGENQRQIKIAYNLQSHKWFLHNPT
ncbi:hypothetical protein [Anaerocolumna jejuensis]|uniref:hypothetical protein n=1 Tax=Anaerocolumna jejuensis TaxID=259063 RepID=UPI003F7CAF3E